MKAYRLTVRQFKNADSQQRKNQSININGSENLFWKTYCIILENGKICPLFFLLVDVQNLISMPYLATYHLCLFSNQVRQPTKCL